MPLQLLPPDLPARCLYRTEVYCVVRIVEKAS
jgi:hypothetical protein